MDATRAAEERATGQAYAAFISYSRAADARLAPRLETALDTKVVVQAVERQPHRDEFEIRLR